MRCEVTELLVDQCGCPTHRGQPDQPAPAAEITTVGQPFPARYPGRCVACDDSILPGQPIARVADDDGYVHAGGCRS